MTSRKFPNRPESCIDTMELCRYNSTNVGTIHELETTVATMEKHTPAELRHAAAKLGADVELKKPGRSWMCNVTAPDGMCWACSPGTTTLTADWYDAGSRNVAIWDLLDRMSQGIEADE